MADIFDLVDAKAIGEYVDTLQGSEEPLLGATLFPNKKIIGLEQVSGRITEIKNRTCLSLFLVEFVYFINYCLIIS